MTPGPTAQAQILWRSDQMNGFRKKIVLISRTLIISILAYDYE